MDLRGKRICVTGGAGFLGHHVTRAMRRRGVLVSRILVPRRREWDLRREADVEGMLAQWRPDVVIHLAAEVGGIGANRRTPGRFFHANMAMGLHLIEAARRHRVGKFVCVGTVCAYPKDLSVPFPEADLWNGYPEPTNAPYGIAKRALAVMLEAYEREYGMRSAYVLPANLYGPGDNFEPATSHVIPALIRRCERARCEGAASVTCWGSGRATREFLHASDAAEGIVRAAERVDSPRPINLGTGEEITVADLAKEIARLTGYSGCITWDETKPDGQPRRCLDITRARQWLGWSPSIDLATGLRQTIEWWRNNQQNRAIEDRP